MATLRSLDFLPSIYRTQTNRKFLGSTLDVLTTEPQLQKISGFVGRTFSPTWSQGDGYLVEPTTLRTNYQLEPSLILTDNSTGLVDSVTTYPDLINRLSSYNVPTNNHSRLFEQEYYNFDPSIDKDKFVNFFQYYWVPEGPDTVDVSTIEVPLKESFLVSVNPQMSCVSMDMLGNQCNPTINLVRGGTYTFNLNLGVDQFWIQTQPGLSGFNSVLSTVPTRDILGVTDNGATQLNSVSFTVPQANAQDDFVNMPLIANVNVACSLTYADVADKTLAEVVTTFGGIDGLRYLNNKTIIFVGPSNADTDWTSSQTQVVVPQSQRYMTWLLTVDVNNIIRLVPQTFVPINNKVNILEGDTYANRSFYISTNYAGQYALMPVITANLTQLFYQVTNDSKEYGVINIVNEQTDSIIDVTTDILGRTTYTSPNGIQFTNGLKIIFGDDAFPSSYQFNAYYVEGVGSSITLVPVSHMVTPEAYANTPIGLATPDFLTMNRASIDRNPWSRSNRWFHIDVLQSTANYNSTNMTLEGFTRATRPIIEFYADYKLVNNGTTFLDAIDVIDFTITDPFMTVEGDIGFFVDQVLLENGTKIVFANATDPVVRQTIYESQLIITQSGTLPIINLTPLTTATVGDNISVQHGNTYSGMAFNYSGSAWLPCQAKYSVNQPIMFDAFDASGNSFTDQAVYPGTTFAGTKIFGYTIGSGAADPILGFPITYRTFNSVGDIQFSNFFDTDTFSFLNEQQTVVQNINIGYLHQTDTSNSSGYDNKNVWVTALENSKQYQHFTFTYESGLVSFPVDISPDVSVLVNNMFVYVNDLLVANDLYSIENLSTGLQVVMNIVLNANDKVDIFIYNSNTASNTAFYEIPDNLEDNAQNAVVASITLGQYRNHLSQQFITATGTSGEFPGLNEAHYAPAVIDTADTIQITSDTTDFTADNLSQFAVDKTNVYAFAVNTQNQILDADTTLYTADNNSFTADSFSTANLSTGGVGVETQNLRDFPSIDQYRGQIIQNSAGIHYAELFLLDNNYNFVNAVRQARYQYSAFKTKFLQAAVTVGGIDQITPAQGVDALMKFINANKDVSFPYFYSDMIPYGTTGVTTSYTVVDPTQMNYNLSSIFDDNALSNRAVLVYLNGSQLTKDIDYTFLKTNAVVQLIDIQLKIADIVEIVDYSSTDGSLVPETPTKLGLYPKFTPQIISDNTYETPIDVIIGHDGSSIPVFGDFRDALLLELELRIYNNIKVAYNNKLDINSIVPGKFRITDYSKAEINQVLSAEFLVWAGQNSIDYSDNQWFLNNDPFTWNYSSFNDKDGDELNGYWRGVYQYFYDTTHPDSRPWEMLGFSQIPDWWISTYGPAPYTSGNTVLWNDLENGYIAGGDSVGINTLYVRPGLSKYIPVDSGGNLLPPTQSVVLNFDATLADENYEFGDISPAEFAWRNSSDYAFSLQILSGLLKPAKYFGLNMDYQYFKNPLLAQYLYTNNERFVQTETSLNGTIVDSSVVRQASFTNWIADFVRTQGVDPLTNMLVDINDMSLQLAYKMASFSDQNYLQVILEQNSPNTEQQGILVPKDNYSVSLIQSSPAAIATYSAVIVELTSAGYTVRGYDTTAPFFNIVPSNVTNNAITISQAGATATIYQDYQNILMSVAYGSTFSNAQQLVDFLVSYQRYLNAIGFSFSERSSALNTQQDWYLSANEFLAWSQQGWGIGSAIVLSPAASKLSLLSTTSVADSLTDSPFGARILDLNSNVIDSTRYTVLRDSSETPNLFQVQTTDGTSISLVSVNLVQWEHALVFDNITDFNDIIYQPSTSDRQYRVRLNGYKTTGWNGSLNTPGFFINQNNVQLWNQNSTYKMNDLVSYKGVYYTANQTVYPSNTFNYTLWQQIDSSTIQTGLIPNFANTAVNAQNFYNVDYVNFSDQEDEHAKGLIGFRPRSYLTNLGVESSSQIKFYQGFITQKGTSSAVDAFTRANFSNLESNVEIYEEWALRVGSYGATQTKLDIDVPLNSATFTGNPQIIEFNPTIIDTSSSVVPALSFAPSQLNSLPLSWNSNPFITGPQSPIGQQLPTAGYVQPQDVDAIIYDITAINEIDNVVPYIGSGYTIWTAKDFNNDWNVFRVSETGNTCLTISNALDGLIQLSFANYETFTEGQILAIKNFSSDFDGFYEVLTVIDLQNVLVAYQGSLTGFVQAQGSGIVFTLQSVRFSTASDMSSFTPVNDWLDGDTTWIDNYKTQGTWSVLEKISPFKFDDYLTRFTTANNANFGSSVASSIDGNYVIVGAPGPGFTSNGGTLVLFAINGDSTISPVQEFAAITTGISGFGDQVIYTPAGWVASAPTSRSNTGYVYTGIVFEQAFQVTQAIMAPDYSVSSQFGGSLVASSDGSYLFIGAPQANKVYMYSLIQGVSPQQTILTSDNVTISFPIGFTPASSQSIIVTDTTGEIVYLPNIDYTITGTTILFNVAPTSNILVTQNTSFYSYISEITASDSISNDNFGASIACNSSGGKLFISAPNNSGLVNEFKAGAVYSFARNTQQFIMNGSTAVIVPTLAISNNVTVTLNGVYQTTNLYSSSYDIIINTSNNTIVFLTTPPAGAIVKVVYGSFSQIQKLGGNSSSEAVNFGNTIDYDDTSSNLVVGAPNETDNGIYYTGSVYRFIDIESSTGVITSIPNPAIVSGDIIAINGYYVSINSSTVMGLAAIINKAGIPSVTASVTSNNALTITSTSESASNKLYVVPIEGNTYTNLGFVPVTLAQVIIDPNPASNARFGYEVALQSGGTELFIGSPFANTFEDTTFDTNTTTFDNNTTHMVDAIPSGSVFVYELQPAVGVTALGNYVEVQQLVSGQQISGDLFGTSINSFGSNVYIGSPDAFDRNTNAGTVQRYVNPTNSLGWNVLNSQSAAIIPNPTNKLFTYSSKTNTIVDNIEVLDPINGFIPGEAKQNIDFISSVDPATYEIVSNGENGLILNPLAPWGAKQIGQVWWDIDTVRFVDYKQGTLAYRATNWATLMPGSSVDVYEWVGSIYLPSEYVANVGDGVPKHIDDSVYSSVVMYDTSSGQQITTYYYWVKNKTSVSVSSPKTLPVNTVAQYITNPQAQGIVFAAILDTNALALYNVVDSVDATNTVLHIEYKNAITENVIHNEYQLVQEGNVNSKVPQQIINKIVDSLVGVDILGNAVPDSTIPVTEQYGTGLRPRQSMIQDRLAGLQIFIDYVNTVCKQYQIAFMSDLSIIKQIDPIPAQETNTGINYNISTPTFETLSFLPIESFPVGYLVLVESDLNFNGFWSIYTKRSNNTWVATRMQSYDTKQYWNYATWYSPDYNPAYTPDFVVATQNDIAFLSNVVSGNLIQINDIGSIVQFNSLGNYTTLTLDNATIQFDSSLFDYVGNQFGFDNNRFDVQSWDQYPVQETRNVLTCVFDSIFTGELAVDSNSLFFRIVNYILSEQKWVDWIFKTSFISVLHQIRELSQVPSYQVDNQTYFQDYLAEVNPYHTVIRDYVLDYTWTDEYLGDISDFDLPAYFDTGLGYYREPDGSQPNDSLLLDTDPQYEMWNNYHLSKNLLSIEVTDGGSGYISAPNVYVTGGGGTGATAYAVLNGDSVGSIIIDSEGVNYTNVPTITISGGGGTDATAVATIGNNLIRSFDANLKFDRVSYTTNVVDWAPNSTFNSNQILKYEGIGYIINPADESLETIDTAYISLDSTIVTVDETVKQYVTGDTFDPTDLIPLSSGDYTNANDRIAVYYSPMSGMPGDYLNQVQVGIDYPGVNVLGLTFEQQPVFDVGGFDTEPFDGTIIGPEGFPVPSESLYDAEISSMYNDPGLGIRPADIIVDGGEYVDIYSSYAPEELIPGSVFDTLDFKVLTLDPTTNTTTVKGIPIDSFTYAGTGHTTTFSYAGGITIGDAVQVYTRNTGYKTQGIDYTWSINTKTINFTHAPAASDIVYIYVMDDAGGNMIYFEEFILNGTTNVITLNAPYNEVVDSFVLFNGVYSTAYALSLAPDNRNTLLTIDTTKTGTNLAGFNVHVHLYSTKFTRAEIHTQTIDINGPIIPSDYVINLDRVIYNVGPLGGMIVVNRNDNRLIPTNTAYYTGDGSTTIFASQATQDIPAYTVVPGDMDVWVSGNQMTYGTQYVLLPPSGTLPATIQFTVAPPAGALISVGCNTGADYTFTGGVSVGGILNNQITIKSSRVTLVPGDVITIFSIQADDLEGIRTQVYLGGTVVGESTLNGFSAAPWDTANFDEPSVVSLTLAQYTLTRPSYDPNYLIVTYNGRRLLPNYDYNLETPTLLVLAPNISVQPTDIVIITSLTEVVQKSPIGYRMFKDMRDNWSYLRMSAAASTTLVRPLSPTDENIFVADVNNLAIPNPSLVLPGIIFIGGERITYWTIDTVNNSIGQLRRGTAGTAVMQNTIPEGTLVEDASMDQEIPFAEGVTWYTLGVGTPSNGQSLVDATTIQAEFLSQEPSFYLS